MNYVDVVIIGGGPGGISTAIWCKRLGLNHLLLEGREELGGQLTKIHNEIIDYPGIKAENGNQLKDRFIEHFTNLGCNHWLGIKVISVDAPNKEIILLQDDNKLKIQYRYLVIATGAGEKHLNIPGEKEMINRGESYSATADRYLFKDKTVAIVGGGDRAFEGAILFAQAGASVYLIHRTKTFKARRQYLNLTLNNEKIKILPDTQLTSIDGINSVKAINLKNSQGKVFTIEVDAVLIRIGIKPNTELVQGIVDIDVDGIIKSNQIGETSNPSIFAVGDICTKAPHSSISASVGQGAVVAKHLASLITTI
ncbi:NAD(P)/FAD-dependent oxidoreductase [Bacillus sp. MRMR6]|uniref:NAD(P)/FAD-dependent oxidoreductase n=1 Tax=Bacillus sp. MRMR6 TaxID=1928617 RepID=UPI000952F780|nr:NAD(P)/FAD-dependent oxidoreductase [Bacillus sp. MRMR6]OLS39965.1 thioredoxin reductase [Bacillus sp. MRMR6]